MRITGANGKTLTLADAYWCDVHQRMLGHYESKGCFWCDPSLIPSRPRMLEVAEIKAWAKRESVWQMIREDYRA
jgi:hypothetical protein